MFSLRIRSCGSQPIRIFYLHTAGALVIVPAYPYGMVFLFGCLGPFVTFTYGRKPTTSSALLPVSKADVVNKLLMVVLAQMAQV